MPAHLRVRVAAVAARPLTFLVSHGESVPNVSSCLRFDRPAPGKLQVYPPGERRRKAGLGPRPGNGRPVRLRVPEATTRVAPIRSPAHRGGDPSGRRLIHPDCESQRRFGAVPGPGSAPIGRSGTARRPRRRRPTGTPAGAGSPTEANLPQLDDYISSCVLFFRSIRPGRRRDGLGLRPRTGPRARLGLARGGRRRTSPGPGARGSPRRATSRAPARSGGGAAPPSRSGRIARSIVRRRTPPGPSTATAPAEAPRPARAQKPRSSAPRRPGRRRPAAPSEVRAASRPCGSEPDGVAQQVEQAVVVVRRGTSSRRARRPRPAPPRGR